MNLHQSDYQARQMTQNNHSIRDTINSYYKQGDVFNRDQSYYDQFQNSTRRDRSRDKSPFNKPNPNTLQINTEGNAGGQKGQQQQVVYAPPVQKPSVLTPSEQLAKLRQENKILRDQVQQYNGFDNKYGSSDQVIKKSHYNTSMKQAKIIAEQEAEIFKYQELIRKYNTKISTYKKAANELDLRMNNIQSIDGQIYKHLKNATSRDKQLLHKATAALAMNQTREEVANILKKIVDN